MTRLGDITELGGLGVPTFQAVRPWSRTLTVSQGKGLTSMAAAVSALLEATEFASAERLRRTRPLASLRSLGRDMRAVWSRRGAEDPLRIALDPGRVRGWVDGRDLLSGRNVAAPHDLLRLDFTTTRPPDLLPSSVGLATGNSSAEALTGGVAEVIEHHLHVLLQRLRPRDRRGLELDLASVDDPLSRTLLDGVARRGFSVLAWSMGQEAGVAAFRCVLFQQRGRRSAMAPASGSGCHPDRRVAFLRALLEAAQMQATLVAGARDDLTLQAYRDGPRTQMEIALAGLCFGPGPLRWRDTPDRPGRCAQANLEALLSAAARLSSSPVIAVAHPDPHPELSLSHVVAPGLLMLGRPTRCGEKRRNTRPAPAIRAGWRDTRPIVFAGPSLPPGFRPIGVELQPPAVCGDLARLLDRPPPAIGLIDGCFEVAATVWHKEILDLLAHGVSVFGAASLGAIRAAELATFGMQGVGAIFTAYAAGAIRRDDAVMLDHAPPELGHRPLTLALVDAEAALLQVAMPESERRMLQRIARTLSFRERTWALCLRLYAERTGRSPSVDAATLAAVPSLKQRDALALIAALTGAVGPPPPRPPLTGYYLRLLATTCPPAQPSARRAEIADAPVA